ncbi:MAG: plastocyanin/azurin family copper-binding protein [archaeon]|jgi:plastocyanin
MGGGNNQNKVVKKGNSLVITIAVLVVLAIIVVAGSTYFLQPQILTSLPSTSAQTNPAPSNQHTPPVKVDVSQEVQTYNIQIKNFAFSPQTLSIRVGDTVVWTNYDITSHTITSDVGNELASNVLLQGSPFSHTFTVPGVYNYHCSVHSSMTGAITVQ